MIRSLLLTLALLCFAAPAAAQITMTQEPFVLWASQLITADANTSYVRSPLDRALGAILILDVTALEATQGFTAIDVEVLDPAGAGWIVLDTVATPPQATGTFVYAIGAHSFVSASIDEVLTVPLPKRWRLAFTLDDQINDATFSVGVVPMTGL